MVYFLRYIKTLFFYSAGSKIYRKYIRMASEASEMNWKGVTLSTIYGSESPWDAPEFPLVSPSHNHTVLYHIPNGVGSGGNHPMPQRGHDQWDQDHVRLPSSPKSLYAVEDENGRPHLKKRWEIIQSALTKPIRNSQELQQAILTYNNKFKDKWHFTLLHVLFNETLEEEESSYFFEKILPAIANLALQLPNLIQAPIPLLKQNKNHSISLTQQQVACLLANAFFCTFPRRNTRKMSSEYSNYPHINFNSLYDSVCESNLEKMKCLCHYFRTVCSKAPTGVVTYSRRCVPPSQLPDWSQSEAQINSVPLRVDSTGRIEDADGLIHVDFANKYLGGGVLNYGCVQEEILFMICPELLLSMLFTEVLKPNEAVLIIGCERFSTYSGYARTFQWSGPFADARPVDAARRRRAAVLAIDAKPFRDAPHEHHAHSLKRELNKAYVGFSFPGGSARRLPALATGNWGCGAFGGSPHLKALLQLMAAAQAGRPLVYYTFSDALLRDQIFDIYTVLQSCNVTVGQLFELIRASPPAAPPGLHCHLRAALGLQSAIKEPVPELSRSLQEEFDADPLYTPIFLENISSNSPDLFSQEDTDASLMEVKVDEVQPTNARISKADNGESPDCGAQVGREDTTMGSSDRVGVGALRGARQAVPSKRKRATDQVSDSCEDGSHTSRLFDEMEKLDEESGKLHLSDTNTSILYQSMRVSSKEGDAEDKPQSDATAELKKKISKKITDYFNKKS